MHRGFGARLRAQREERRVALATVSERTKIKLSLLEALERDDLSHWPTGIFRRSYIRSCAQAIGLDPDTLLREFLLAHPESGPEADATLPKGDDPTMRRPPMRLRFLLGSAIEALPALRAATVPFVERIAVSSATPVLESPVLPLREPAEAPMPESAATTMADPAVVPVMAPRVEVRSASRSADLSVLAQLCTRLACAEESRDVPPVLEDAASLLDAVGLVLWLWDAHASMLRPVFSHGYSADVVDQMPGLSIGADTAVTVSFRSVETCIVEGHNRQTGAIVVPLTTPAGCAGVLAIELRGGAEQRDDVRAIATILAAQLSTLVGYPALAHAATA
jgi:cytoskeleton protein RodZ